MTGGTSSSYEVWAVLDHGDPEIRRFFGGYRAACAKALCIACASGMSSEEGAVSVYVKGPEGIVWAAGEKAQELKSEGYGISDSGSVVRGAT